MALSDQLSRLASRSKELEDRAAAVKQQTKADLQHDVKQAREESQARADALANTIDESKADVSAWWNSMGRSWNDHVASVRKNIGDKRAAHDLKAAERAVRQADDDASYAVDYAYSAVEEAEYAVLDAILARMEADQLAQAN
jgi:hypothetical protein